MSEAIRLDKHLVALIQCSRGEAQKYIEGGWVLVDG
ncbi:S4 domain-containing protein, partial [uncultured Paraglaciecola sp.]